jgi:acyl-coenzyme A thioesterase PaaI-like protein
VSELLDRIRAFREEGNTAGMTDAVPYAKFLGITVHAEEGQIVGKLTYGDHLIGNPALPALHGGTVGALLESTAIFHLMWEAETIVIPKTINVTVDYLRSGRPMDTFAKGIITKHGRRVVNVRAEAWQEDPTRPIAIGNAHFLIEPAP